MIHRGICSFRAVFLGFTLLVLPVGDMAAQSVLLSFSKSGSGGAPMEIGSFNLATCSYTTIMTDIDTWFSDFLLASDSTWYLVGCVGSTSALYTVDPLTSNTTLLTILGSFCSGGTILELGPDTLVVAINDTWYLYYPSSNSITPLGVHDLNGFTELFVFGGNLYCVGNFGGPNGLYQIDLLPVFTATLLHSPPTNVGFATSTCGNVFSIREFSTEPTFYEYNMATNTYNVLCYDVEQYIPQMSWTSQNAINISTAPDPANPTGPLCDCTTESGTFAGTGLLEACEGQPIALPHNGDQTLDADDILVFVLTEANGSFGIFQNNYPNGVLHQYTEPTATFLPGITEYGQFYYIWAIAGNDLGGSVDFFDICREISLPRIIRWRQAPTVLLTLQPGCPSGCQQVGVAFTGTPPFNLTYTVTTNGAPQAFTQTFNTTTGSMEVCPPAGYEGPMQVAAVSITDASCTCE